MDVTNAANPAAEEAKPAAVGKLFSETMCNFICDNFGESGVSIDARKFLKSAKHAWVRGVSSDSNFPLSHNWSFSNDGEAEAVVNVRKSSWDKVTEIDELVGKFNDLSRFPQYLRV